MSTVQGRARGWNEFWLPEGGGQESSTYKEVARDTALMLTCREVILEAKEWVKGTEDEEK